MQASGLASLPISGKVCVFSPSSLCSVIPHVASFAEMQVAWTALHKASDNGNAASVEVLLKQEGVDVNARDEVIELTRLGRDAFSRPPRIPCRAAAPLFTALL